jgi:hypothetical protein
MPTSSQSYRDRSDGQIALERALFCLECELIFAGIAYCPRCSTSVVWPLMQWLPPTRPSLSVIAQSERRSPDLHLVGPSLCSTERSYTKPALAVIREAT